MLLAEGLATSEARGDPASLIPTGGLFGSFHVHVHGRAGAYKIAVSVDVVDAIDRRPIFIDPESAGGKHAASRE